MCLSDNGMLSNLARHRISCRSRVFLLNSLGRCEPWPLVPVTGHQPLHCSYQTARPEPLPDVFRSGSRSSQVQIQGKDESQNAQAELASSHVASAIEKELPGKEITRIRISKHSQTLPLEQAGRGSRPDPPRLRQPIANDHHDSILKDTRYWRRKFYNRKRLFGDGAAKHVWTEFKKIEIQKAPSLFKEQHFLRGLIAVGFRDSSFLEDICRYLRRAYEIKREVAPRSLELYKTIVGHVLARNPSAGSVYHVYLKCFSPDRYEVLDLAVRLAGNEEGCKTLRKLCLEFEFFKDIYDLIVPSLCGEELYDDAYEWHHFIIENGYKPCNPISAECLSRHLENSGQHQRSKEVMTDLKPEDHLVNIQFTELDQERHEMQIILSEMEKGSPLNTFSPKSFSDEFCARLFATRFFSVETIIRGLEVLQTCDVGPLSLRAMLLRITGNEQCDAQRVCRLLDLLSQAGISLGKSLFCRLIQKLAKEGNNILLYDMAVCDQHPDVLEDWILQETLLAQYEAIGDERQVQRTLAILLMDARSGLEATKMMNVLLRSALTRGNDNDVMNLLEAMRQRDLLVSARSLSWMYKRLVPQRLERKLPVTKNLRRLISVWQHLMVSGTEIPPKTWDDALRTLLIQGSLDDYESLSIWLARWFTDSKYRDSATNRLSQSRNPIEGASTGLHPDLQGLFNLQFFHEIVLWGFFHGTTSETSKKKLQGTSLKQRARSLSKHPAFWGLRHLSHLKTNGINIPDHIARRVCQQRLRSMFSEGFRTKHVNQHIQKHRLGNIEEYVAAMEMIWGPKLFLRTESIHEFGERMIQGANLHWRYRLQRLDNWRARSGSCDIHFKTAGRPVLGRRRQ